MTVSTLEGTCLIGPGNAARSALGVPAPGSFRRLYALERDRLVTHLLRLSEADRRSRFCGVVNASSVRAYANGIDMLNSVVIGYFHRRELRAAGKLVFEWSAANGPCAEIALSVESPLQDRGIGFELLRRLLLIARNRGIRAVQLHFLRDNVKMRALALKAAGTLVAQADMVTGIVHLRWPTPLTILEEALRHYVGWLLCFASHSETP